MMVEDDIPTSLLFQFYLFYWFLRQELTRAYSDPKFNMKL